MPDFSKTLPRVLILQIKMDHFSPYLGLKNKKLLF